MKRKIIYKKTWNAGIDVIYDDGKEIKLILSEDEFCRNLVDAVIRNLDSRKLTWSVRQDTINSIVSESVRNAFSEISSDVKRDTWKRLV